MRAAIDALSTPPTVAQLIALKDAALALEDPTRDMATAIRDQAPELRDEADRIVSDFEAARDEIPDDATAQEKIAAAKTALIEALDGFRSMIASMPCAT